MRKRDKTHRLLSTARIEALEEERRRLARELHDGLGQILSAVRLTLIAMEREEQPDAVKQKQYNDVKALLDSAVSEARQIAYNLMPSILDDFGIVPALQTLCEQFSTRSKFEVSFLSRGLADRFRPQLEIALFRIAQEAFNNIAKHSKASEVQVEIIRHGRTLRLTIRDNGRGFKVRSTAVRANGEGGMGLANMRERAELFNGALNIESGRGMGTSIVVEIPITDGKYAQN